MYFFYSLLYTLAFVLMSPLFLLRRSKYAAGFSERLGNYPEFKRDERPMIWLHCVSVGETNAARPLVDELISNFPGHRLIVSTTTKTGQTLARDIFKDKADAVFYFPFDWKFSVRCALDNFQPSVVLLMETEIWPRFFRESHLSGAKIAIVNGRLSEKSVARYSYIKTFVRNVLGNVDLALMQGESDAERIRSLGIDADKVRVTGNMKFDLELSAADEAITGDIDSKFQFSSSRPLIIAASTHEPEERWMLEAFCSLFNGDTKPRLMIAPRHPERFDSVAKMIDEFRNDDACEWRQYIFARRSDKPTNTDGDADVVLLDSIGELRAVYPLADVVFVGGSLIRHGGQSVLEPAAAGKAILTGCHTHNFEDVIRTFENNKAVIRISESDDSLIVDELFTKVTDLLGDQQRLSNMGIAAAAVMKANRGATAKTLDCLSPLLGPSKNQ